MADSYDYLNVSNQDKQVLKNLSGMGEKLKSLKQTMLEKEAEYELAKKEYEHYSHVVIPAEMFAAGVDSVSLASGGVLSVQRKYYCQPNKNADDQRIIAEWLRAHNGEYLIEANAVVDGKDADNLKEAGIPFIEKTAVNTNKLKSFLKDMVGVSSGVQKCSIEDIPACIHFQEVTTVDISL